MSIKTKKRNKKIIALIILILLASVAAASIIYLSDYYRAEAEAIDAFASMGKVSFEVTDDETVIFAPEGAAAGFIFYPGGKVEYTAYLPLMAALAEKGILCVLPKMPFNLAVFDVNAADGIKEEYPEITDWYIGGHSLGGSMAATHLANNTDKYLGLVLLGSYSTADLSSSDIKVLSVYGSEDGVMNREKYAESLANMPGAFEEHIIDGGCHAYFGMYGSQEGDGTPTLDNSEQIYKTAELIADFIK